MFRSILFTVILFVSVIPQSLVIVLVRPFGIRVSYGLGRWWARKIIALCKGLCGLGYVVEGEENLPGRASVVLLKHSSSYETIAQWLIFPRQTWVLKREIMWAPFLGWGVAAIGPIAINRNAGRAAVRQVLSQGKKKLQQGTWIMVFPEGTRSAPGESRRYGISGVLLAQQSHCLVVPVAHNAGDFWRRRGWRKKPGTVKFVIGPPIDPSGRDPREVTQEVKAWIETKVTEIRNSAVPPVSQGG